MVSRIASDRIELTASRELPMQDPSGPQQERVGNDVQQIDEVQQLGREAHLPCRGIHVNFARDDGQLSLPPVGRAHRQRNFARVSAEQEVSHGDIGRVVLVLGERLFGHRHLGRQRQSVDRDDMVAGLDAGAAGVRPDREADGGCVLRRHRKAGTAAEQELGIVGRRRVAEVNADRRSGEGKQEDRDPEEREDPVDRGVERGHRRRQHEAAL